MMALQKPFLTVIPPEAGNKWPTGDSAPKKVEITESRPDKCKIRVRNYEIGQF